MLCFLQGFQSRKNSKRQTPKRMNGLIYSISTDTALQSEVVHSSEDSQDSSLKETELVGYLKNHMHTALDKHYDDSKATSVNKSTPCTIPESNESPEFAIKSISKLSLNFTSTSRQKKFHRHFTQVNSDEQMVNYYRCIFVGDILLQGHLYITANYFAFHSKSSGTVTKLLIPVVSIKSMSKEKATKSLSNSIVIVTKEEEKYIFGSFMTIDWTFKLLKQLWDTVIDKSKEAILPISGEPKLLSWEIMPDDEVIFQEEISNISMTKADLSSRLPAIYTDIDGETVSNPADLEKIKQQKRSEKVQVLRSLIRFHSRPATIIAILIALLAVLYIFAGLMMLRINKLHTAYLNQPLVSPKTFSHDRVWLMHYLNTNLDQIIKVRESLQTLSEKFSIMNHDFDGQQTSSTMKPIELSI